LMELAVFGKVVILSMILTALSCKVSQNGGGVSIHQLTYDSHRWSTSGGAPNMHLPVAALADSSTTAGTRQVKQETIGSDQRADRPPSNPKLVDQHATRTTPRGPATRARRSFTFPVSFVWLGSARPNREQCPSPKLWHWAVPPGMRRTSVLGVFGAGLPFDHLACEAAAIEARVIEWVERRSVRCELLSHRCAANAAEKCGRE
jgi:hypothetical protein